MISSYAHNGARSTAYSYMKPYERLCSFIKGMVHIVGANVERMKDEVELWDLPEAQALFGPEMCALEKLNTQSVLDQYLLDLDKYTTLEAKLGACTSCSGKGWYWVNDSQDESHRETCEKCKGCGKTFAVAAKLMVIGAQKAAAEVVAEGEAQVEEKAGFLTMVARKFK